VYSCCICKKSILIVLPEYKFTEAGIAHNTCYKKPRAKPGFKRGYVSLKYLEEKKDPEFKFEYDEAVYQELLAAKKARAVMGFPCTPDRGPQSNGKTLHKI